MLLNTKPVWGLYILLFTCVCDVYTACNYGESVRPVTRSTDSKEYPSSQFVLDTYFQLNFLTDKCATSQALDWFKIKSSTNQVSVGPSPEFRREYLGRNGETVYSSSGKYFVRTDSENNNYVSYTILGGKSSYQTVRKSSMEGRMYILRIEPPPTYNYETSSWTAEEEEKYGGSVITYYSCLESVPLVRQIDATMIVQTPIKKDSSRAENNLVKSQDTSSLNLPTSTQPIRCYE